MCLYSHGQGSSLANAREIGIETENNSEII